MLIPIRSCTVGSGSHLLVSGTREVSVIVVSVTVGKTVSIGAGEVVTLTTVFVMVWRSTVVVLTGLPYQVKVLVFRLRYEEQKAYAFLCRSVRGSSSSS
jgi:hypothetical protein